MVEPMAERVAETNGTTVVKVKPSARGWTLEWFSLGPEYCASVWTKGVIQGCGFGPTEEAAIAAAKEDAKRFAA